MKIARNTAAMPILISPRRPRDRAARYEGGMVYTMGDPGLGSFLKKVGGAALNVAKTVGKAVLGVQDPAQLMLPPGYGGTPPIQEAMPRPPIATLPPPRGLPPVSFDPPFGGEPGAAMTVGRTRVQTGGGAGMIKVTRTGSQPGTGPRLSVSPQQAMPQQIPPQVGGARGVHLNKSDYFLRDGTFVPAGTRWVTNRRRNPLNPRALDRAIGRIGSAKRAASRLGRITIRKACD